MLLDKISLTKPTYKDPKLIPNITSNTPKRICFFVNNSFNIGTKLHIVIPTPMFVIIRNAIKWNTFVLTA